MTEMCAFMEVKKRVFLSASDPEGLRWGQSGVRIFGSNEMIVENGLSENDYCDEGYSDYHSSNPDFCNISSSMASSI